MKNIHRISASIAVLGFLVVASAAYAQSTATTGKHLGHGAFARPIVGTVSAISGSTLSVTVESSSTAAITTYSVNASNAKVLKSGATTTLSSIQINDKIAVIGTVSGTDITAKAIIDGFMPHTTGPPAEWKGGRTGSTNGRSFASSTRPFMRPAAFGTVSAITGDASFTLAQRTKTGTTTMTIDTDSSTAFQEGTTTASFSDIAIGNLVAVTGTTTATNEILASKVMIMPKLAFGKGNHGGWKGPWKGKKSATSTPQ